MLILKNIFKTSFRTRTAETLLNNINTRCAHESYFVSEDEIMENVLGQFLTIGINLPDTKNLLTESALQKLDECIKHFESNNEMKAAVLHGCGGNFCCGMVGTDNSIELGQNLIKTLHTVKKPIIAALDGYTTDYGQLIAAMCDMRVMDKSALVGSRDKSQKFEIPLFLCERLILTVGLARTTEFLCTRHMWSATECLGMGFINKISDSGCSLGQSMLLAQNMAFNNQLEDIIKHKSKILSLLTRCNEHKS